MSADAVQELLDRAAIQETKARYFRYIDTKQWDKWRTVFSDDARFVSSKEWDNPDSFVADVSAALADQVTVHQGHMPEIVFTSKDTARVIWAMYDYVEDMEAADGRRGIVGFGHYEEEYTRVGDEWKISFLRLTRLRVDPLVGEHPPIGEIPRRHSPDWLPSRSER
jgi:hypothetical protein